ncbi:hypothetical protein CDD83_4263 [Cordyceps sp. RAO-2017]|nr:hypothetical protein CDD83_4263 [Cordyceps sp. RAO-2017]
MLSRLAIPFAKMAARPVARRACGPSLLQARLVSQRAAATGSTGRKMPFQGLRATAPVASLPATFTIRDGPVFQGKAFGANSNISGEAVFTTSLVGYPESMTDPSHWTAVESLGEWCAREGVPAISGVDTRAIVTFLREQGSSLARISIGDEYDADEDESFVDPGQINLVKRVSTKAPFVVESPGASFHVALLDCGVKENILRSLVNRGASVTVFPHNYPIHKVAQHFDGVFISNGPGDPTHCQETVYNLARLMETSSIPIMGICLGHQLLALAVGARTIKLKYGNRAHNIPALDLTTGQCHITSQNHGYAVDASTLPDDFKEYFVNLNDGSNEGMLHKTRPIFSTQFHPEAKGGPMDSAYLFDKYLQNVQLAKSSQQVYKDNRPSQFVLDILSKERVGVEPAPLASAA